VTVQSKLYYFAVCDCCGEAAEYGDYSAWSDEGQAREFLDSGFTTIGDEDFCSACWCWPEDLEGYDEATWEGTDDPMRRHAEHPKPAAALSSLAPDTDYQVQVAWHDEPARWERTGHLDAGPCQCAECTSSRLGEDPS
jgi:hypothetical protein